VSKKKKRKVLKKKNILISFIVLLFLGCLFYYVFTMPVRNVYISGNYLVSDEEIRTLAGLQEYPSFLLSKKSEMKNNLEKNQYIDSVRISKKFGNIISIFVKEFRIVAISVDYKLILSNGLKIDNNYDITDVPILVNEISNEDVYHHFVRKFENIESDILRQISQIEYSPVDVDDERFLLYMNDGNLVYITLTKINKINRYNAIKDKIGDKRGVIYLDAGDYVELKES